MEDASQIMNDAAFTDNDRRFIFSVLKTFPDPKEYLIGVESCPLIEQVPHTQGST